MTHLSCVSGAVTLIHSRDKAWNSSTPVDLEVRHAFATMHYLGAVVVVLPVHDRGSVSWKSLSSSTEVSTLSLSECHSVVGTVILIHSRDKACNPLQHFSWKFTMPLPQESPVACCIGAALSLHTRVMGDSKGCKTQERSWNLFQVSPLAFRPQINVINAS